MMRMKLPATENHYQVSKRMHSNLIRLSQ